MIRVGGLLHFQCLVGVAMNYYPPRPTRALYIVHVGYVCRSGHKIKAMFVIAMLVVPYHVQRCGTKTG